MGRAHVDLVEAFAVGLVKVRRFWNKGVAGVCVAEQAEHRQEDLVDRERRRPANRATRFASARRASTARGGRQSTGLTIDL
jgi:hypothetical protein